MGRVKPQTGAQGRVLDYRALCRRLALIMPQNRPLRTPPTHSSARRLFCQASLFADLSTSLLHEPIAAHSIGKLAAATLRPTRQLLASTLLCWMAQSGALFVLPRNAQISLLASPTRRPTSSGCGRLSPVHQVPEAIRILSWSAAAPRWAWRTSHGTASPRARLFSTLTKRLLPPAGLGVPS